MSKIEIDRKIIGDDIFILYSDKSVKKIPIPKPAKKINVDADRGQSLNSGHVFKES
jgi:hypothetical protein